MSSWSPEDDCDPSKAPWSKELHPDRTTITWRLDVVSERYRAGRLFMGELIIKGNREGELTLALDQLDEST